jgi:hypothetical protein
MARWWKAQSGRDKAGAIGWALFALWIIWDAL